MGDMAHAGRMRTLLLGMVSMLLAASLAVLALGVDRADAATAELTAQGFLTTQAGSTVDAATAISLGKAVSGTTSNWGDENWYKVNLTKAGSFQIKFTGKYKSGGSWNVSLRDKDNQEMWDGDCEAKDCLAGKAVTMHVTGLPKGTYYIRVKGYGVDSLVYKMTPVFTASSVWEREWNDDVGQSNAITLGKAVNGAAKSWGDEDWYKVSLTKAGRLQIKFTGKYKSSGSWNVSLRDKDNREMWDGDCEAKDCLAGKAVTMHVTGLPKGTYYIRVKGYGVNNLVYKMNPVFTASGAWEREWNDDVSQSNAIALGKDVNGTAKGWGEEDWYKVNLPKAGIFQVKFTGKYKGSGEWYVNLFDKNKNNLAEASYGASTRATKTLLMKNLKAGTYYLQVKGYGVNNLVYRMNPNYNVQAPASVKATAAKKAFTVQWKRVSGATKYQVRYSLKSDMSSAKKITVSKDVSKKKISSLKAKKRYYVQVRTVRNIGGNNYFSAWTAARSVITKK